MSIYKTIKSSVMVKLKWLLAFVLLTLSSQLVEASLNKTEKILLKKDFPLLYFFDKYKIHFSKISPDLTIPGDDACKSPSCFAPFYQFDTDKMEQIGNQLALTYSVVPALKQVVAELRKQGSYALFENLSDTAYLHQAWILNAKGINNIVDVYLKGKAPRYPKIDSISFTQSDVKFTDAVEDISEHLSKIKSGELEFYTRPVYFSIKLLMLNGRDEAARYEPLASGMNKKPFKQIGEIKWNNYKYSTILVPGLGPEEVGVKLDPNGAIRCDSAALRYRNGLAPFIVVSGGHVHPNKTPFCEAVEMKKYMVDSLKIPASVIFIEPHARHTTTNLRNLNRMIYSFGIPPKKPVLIVTDISQSKYIVTNMGKTAVRDLGYEPFTDMKKLSEWETEYYPSWTSMHMDPLDPLDP